MLTAPKTRIAVLASDDTVRDSMAVLLRAAGSCTLDYPSAEALLADPRSRSADWLVLHQEANGRSGLDVLRRLRGRGVSVRAILITENVLMRLGAVRQELSVEAVLEGPIVAKDLLRLLRLRP